ncbi:hypothetical protein [Paenibacillus wulumuqiensis]|uniref:hypothetical protein n=1 Tax=Paenibacillus wulumuqiensis TaxID=1567107 RepID=UPI0006195C32|nr:hypothetical protein [Paenibacillus wulumuqiensis]
MRVNPIEAVRRITAEVAAYTRQMLIRREQKQAERSEQQIQQTADTAVNFDHLLEKIPQSQAPKLEHVQQVPRPQSVSFKMSTAAVQDMPIASQQRLSTAQKAYEVSMLDQSMVTIEPFDSRA